MGAERADEEQRENPYGKGQPGDCVPRITAPQSNDPAAHRHHPLERRHGARRTPPHSAHLSSRYARRRQANERRIRSLSLPGCGVVEHDAVGNSNPGRETTPHEAGPSRPCGAARRAAWRISSRLQSHPQASRPNCVMGVADAPVTYVMSSAAWRPAAAVGGHEKMERAAGEISPEGLGRPSRPRGMHGRGSVQPWGEPVPSRCGGP